MNPPLSTMFMFLKRGMVVKKEVNFNKTFSLVILCKNVDFTSHQMQCRENTFFNEFFLMKSYVEENPTIENTKPSTVPEGRFRIATKY